MFFAFCFLKTCTLPYVLNQMVTTQRIDHFVIHLSSTRALLFSACAWKSYRTQMEKSTGIIVI